MRKVIFALLAWRPFVVLLPLLALYAGIALVASPGPHPVNDEIDYVGLAANLVHGDYAYSGGPGASTGPWAREPNLWFGPGLPATLAPLVALHAPLFVIRLTGPLFLFLAVLVFYRLLRLYTSRRRSLAGAATLGLYYPFFTLLDFVHSEPLAILLSTAAAYFVARAFREGTRRHLVFAGIALGYLAMTRVAYGWVLIALLVVATTAALVARRSAWPRKTAAIAAIALVVCVPWLVYTYSLSGRILYWGNSGGSSLYWMASPYPGEAGEWHSPSVAFDDPRFAAHRPFFSRLARMSSLDRDRALQEQAVRFIREHPSAYLKHVALNTSRLFFSVPASFEPISLRTLAKFGFPNLCLLLAVLGAIAVRARRRLRLPPEALVISALALLAIGVHVLLAGYSRMLMPTIPLLLWFVFSSAVAAREARVRQPAREPHRLPVAAPGTSVP
jgi:4-amino-4-deoxy-L-arabinose transferase-like glycosyltransferase